MAARHVCDFTTPKGVDCTLNADPEARQFVIQVWETCPVVGHIPGMQITYSFDTPTGREIALLVANGQTVRLASIQG